MIPTGVSGNIQNHSISKNSYAYQQDETKNDASKKSDNNNNNNKINSENAPKGLTDKEIKEIEALKKRDAEVKAHEQAHKSAGGQYAGAASFEYQTGPDGMRYAVGGEVPIDVSEIPDNPEATVTKMEIVQKAALAPVEPSSADRAIASSASMKEMEARSEITKEALETKQKDKTDSSIRDGYTDQPEKGSSIDIKI